MYNDLTLFLCEQEVISIFDKANVNNDEELRKNFLEELENYRSMIILEYDKEEQYYD